MRDSFCLSKPDHVFFLLTYKLINNSVTEADLLLGDFFPSFVF